MINSSQISIQLKNVFDKYKFTKDQRSKVVLDLLHSGEMLFFDKLAIEMTPEQKKAFSEYLELNNDKQNEEEKIEKILAFLFEIFSEEKVKEAHNTIFEDLIQKYISHMSAK